MLRTVRALLAVRRTAVSRGEVARMWPGAAWDVAALAWFRYLWHPMRDRVRGPGLDEVYHSPAGDCPLCRERPRRDA